MLLGGCGGGGSTAATTSAPAVGTPQIDTRTPQLRHLQAVMLTVLSKAVAAGHHDGGAAAQATGVSATVEDLTTSAPLFAQGDTVPRPPGQVQQLYTGFAAMTLLGARGQLPGTVLGSGHSPAPATLPALVSAMNGGTDGGIADRLAIALDQRQGGSGTLAGGAARITSVINGRDRLGASIADGSGRASTDRTTTSAVVQLLQNVTGTPAGRLLRASLPTTGVSGPVRAIGAGTTASGRCQAVLGALPGVSTLAGWCSALRGHTLAFALFIDGPSNVQAAPLLGRMIAAIAAY